MAEYLIPISIEYLEEGEYLATSPVLQGFIAQGRTIAETIEIAEDVAQKIIESCIEHGDTLPENLPIGTSPNFKLMSYFTIFFLHSDVSSQYPKVTKRGYPFQC